MGDVPFLALAASDPDGLVGRWLAKNGPGVQSLAWEVPDMWASQNHLHAGRHRDHRRAHRGPPLLHAPTRHLRPHARAHRRPPSRRSPQRLAPDGWRSTAWCRWRASSASPAVVVDLEPVAALLEQVFGAEPRPVRGRRTRGDGATSPSATSLCASSRRSTIPASGTKRLRAGAARCTRSRSQSTSTPRSPGSRRGDRHRPRNRNALARPHRHVRDPPPTGRG